MTRVLLVFLFLVGCASSGTKNLEPMILKESDKALLSFPEFRLPSLSPSGKYFAVVSRRNNRSYITAFETASKKIISNTESEEEFRVNQFIWVSDSKLVVVGKFIDGYLKGDYDDPHIYRIDINENTATVLYPAPGIRNAYVNATTRRYLTVIGDGVVRDHYLLVSEIFVNKNGQRKQVSLLDTRSGNISFVDGVSLTFGEYAVDSKHRVRIAIRRNKSKGITVFSKDLTTNNWVEKESFSKGMGNVRIIGFLNDDKTFYFLADPMKKGQTKGLYKSTISFGGDFGEPRLVFSNTETNVFKVLRNKKSGQVEFATAGPGQPKVKVLAKTPRTSFYKKLKRSFPREQIFLSEKKGPYRMVKSVTSHKPEAFYLFDEKSREVKELLAKNEKVRGLKTVPSRPVRYKTRDGYDVHGFLYKPSNWTPRTPMILYVHGGPYGVYDEWGYEGDLQMLVANGFSVMHVNYRGSGGYGKYFEKIGYQQLGGKMQEDLADAAKWANQKGIAPKGKICLWGISYGAYASVMSTTLFPDLFACGAAFGGVYDWSTFLDQGDTIGNDWARASWGAFLSKTKAEQLKQSPISRIGELKRPLLIMHGTDDVRCVVDQARDLRDRMIELEKPHKYVEFGDIGHWFYDNQEKKNQAFNELIVFFNKHLKRKKN